MLHEYWFWVLGLVIVCIVSAAGFVLKSAFNKSEKRIGDLEFLVQSLMVSLPTSYMTKEETYTQIQRVEQTQLDQYGRIETKLDRIFDKLDKKEDKK